MYGNYGKVQNYLKFGKHLLTPEDVYEYIDIYKEKKMGEDLLY